MTIPAFQANGLVKRFGKTPALAGVDLTAERGTVLAVLGPNGAGKTTAINVLATLLVPDEGSASVCGLDVVRDAEQVRRRIGLTGQYASVDEDLTGAENLVLFAKLLDLRTADAKGRATELLDQFQLTDAKDRRVATYSGGMRRRLDLAASLITRPDVVFLDEPTTGLDPGKREDLWRMIRQITGDGGTVLLTTQYLEEADALADEITVVDHGRVISTGTPAELKQVVGGQTVVVRPTRRGDLSTVARILNEVSGRSPEATSNDVLRVAVDGDADFTTIVGSLDEHGIGVTELSLRLPSLDEAFFGLTGRHTDEHTKEANEVPA